MINPRLKGFVNRFGEKYKLEDKLPFRFQQFINYLFLKKIYFETNGIYPYESLLSLDLLSAIDLDDGEEKAMAIDGCFAIYKKEIFHLNLDDEEILNKFKNIETGDLIVCLLQTKSGKLDTTNLSTLSDCLNTKFKGQNKWQKLVRFRNNCETLIQDNPNVNIKFYTIYIYGNETDNSLFNQSNFKVREDALKQSMKDFFWINNENNCFINYYNEDLIYQEYQQQVEFSKVINETIVFEHVTKEITCSEYGKVRVGIINLKEIAKILINNNTNKPNELYGYNVRDHIDQSGVNKKIEDTLNNENELFLLLNNGITIVVDEQERKGDEGIYLKNIRIVNGCQTCHAIMKVLKENSECLNAKIVVKIIQTKTTS